MMVEMLAAGVTGANWSLDAPSFTEGSESPGTGLLVIAIEPKLLDPDFEQRAAVPIERLQRQYGVYIPGRSGAEAATQAAMQGISEFAARSVGLGDTWRLWPAAKLSVSAKISGARGPTMEIYSNPAFSASSCRFWRGRGPICLMTRPAASEPRSPQALRQRPCV